MVSAPMSWASDDDDDDVDETIVVIGTPVSPFGSGVPGSGVVAPATDSPEAPPDEAIRGEEDEQEDEEEENAGCPEWLVVSAEIGAAAGNTIAVGGAMNDFFEGRRPPTTSIIHVPQSTIVDSRDGL